MAVLQIFKKRFPFVFYIKFQQKQEMFLNFFRIFDIKRYNFTALKKMKVRSKPLVKDLEKNYNSTKSLISLRQFLKYVNLLPISDASEINQSFSGLHHFLSVSIPASSFPFLFYSCFIIFFPFLSLLYIISFPFLSLLHHFLSLSIPASSFPFPLYPSLHCIISYPFLSYLY